MYTRRIRLGLAALLLGFATTGANAAEVTLKAVSVFPKGNFFARHFETFVERVNAQGKGKVQIRLLGGPDAMPPLQVGNALKGGVIDLANTTGVFHANLVPEAVALTLTTKPIAELRKNGAYDLMNKIHQDKAQIYWLGRDAQHLQYHIYLTKKPSDADFKGLRLRSVPVYNAFFKALGANPMTIAPGEVYTALERGVIDGYGWPIAGVFDLGWQERTKVRVDPGFYAVETGIFMSLKSWSALDADQQAFLKEQMAWLEDQSKSYVAEGKAEADKQAKAGIEVLTLPAADAAKFVATANEAGWAAILAASPQYGAELKKLLAD